MAPDVLYRYNALDSISTARVFSLAWDELLKGETPGRVTTDLYEHYERLIRHLTPTLTQIESWGMPVAMDAGEDGRVPDAAPGGESSPKSTSSSRGCGRGATTRRLRRTCTTS